MAHDPGGYDVIRPVYDELAVEGSCTTELLLTGAAREQHGEYGVSEEKAMKNLREKIKNQKAFILVTGTSWGSEIETDAIHICKHHQIPTIAILDYWSNYRDRFKRGDSFVFPDHLLVMDELAKKEAVEEGIGEGIIHIVGHPGLDYYVNKKAENRKNRKILFLSQPLSALYGNSYGYTEFTAFDGVLRAGRELGYSVDIKFHPKETNEMVSKYRDLSVDGALEDLAGKYEKIAGMSTMGLLQLSVMGVPVISYQPGIQLADCCITNKLGITKGAYSYGDLIKQLTGDGVGRKVRCSIWHDGKSTGRCCEYIKSVIADMMDG